VAVMMVMLYEFNLLHVFSYYNGCFFSLTIMDSELTAASAIDIKKQTASKTPSALFIHSNMLVSLFYFLL
jgi:hypothetical protein